LKIPYWHVDAFAFRAFTGNPAAVMFFDSLPEDDVLGAIAVEANLPATAFLSTETSGAADYDICWFTPASEIALCGHGTIAAGHAMLQQTGAEQVRFRTRTRGVVEVRRAPAGYELSLPVIETVEAERPEVEGLFGPEPQSIWLNPDRYGIYLFEDEQQLRSLEPDFEGLAKLGPDQFICTAPGDHTDIVSRVFAPGAGYHEDSVTGSAHSALAPFWAARLGREELTAHQASKRGGDLALRLDRQAGGGRVWLGGNCVTVAEGQFYLSG